LVLEAVTRLGLKSFPAPMLGDGFGHVFKRAICLWLPGDCPHCLVKTSYS
jgi:hypothetical protein